MIEVLRLLHEMEQGSSRYSRSYYCRHLDKHESIPQFGHGITELPLSQKDWIWLAYSTQNDEPLAILAAAPMQGIAMLLRIYATDSASSHVFVGLLRKSFADMLSRGYTRYSVFLGDDNKFKDKLLRLVMKAGGEVIEGSFIMAHGNTDISHW